MSIRKCIYVDRKINFTNPKTFACSLNYKNMFEIFKYYTYIFELKLLSFEIKKYEKSYVCGTSVHHCVALRRGTEAETPAIFFGTRGDYKRL